MTFGTLLYCKSCILKLSDIITTSLLHFERDYALIVFYICCPENKKWKPEVFCFPYIWLKVSKSRKQIMVSSILPKNLKKLTIQSIFSTQDSEFRSFYGIIEGTIICFQGCLTFRELAKLSEL